MTKRADDACCDDAVALAERRHVMPASAYLAATWVLGIGAAAAGVAMAGAS